MGNANDVSSRRADPSRQQGKNAHRRNGTVPQGSGETRRAPASSDLAAKKERILKGYLLAAAAIFMVTALFVFIFPFTIDSSILSAKISTDALEYSFEDGVLTVSGTGPMKDFEYGGISEKAGVDPPDIKEVHIEPGVTSIGGHAFAGCYNLSYVSISDSVTSIGDGAFLNCVKLTSLALPDTVTSIGDHAFDGCRDTVTISTTENALYVQEYAEANGIPCTIDEQANQDDFTYTFKDGVLTISGSGLMPEYLSREGFGLTVCADLGIDLEDIVEVTIEPGIESIGDYTFAGCVNLRYVDIPDSVFSIGKGAFAYCESLSGIVLLDNILSIGDYAFEGCEGIVTICTTESALPVLEYAEAYGINLDIM